MHISPCGVLDNGRDCLAPAVPGIDLNICIDHLKEAAHAYSWIVASAPPMFRLRTPCPSCGAQGLMGDVVAQTQQCRVCDYSEKVTVTHVDPPRKPNGIDPQASVVYYLRFGDRIKIGTSQDLQKRLTVIPHDELLAVERGGRETEHARHVQFHHLHIQGEWFQAAPDLLAHVKMVGLSRWMGDTPKRKDKLSAS